MMVRNDAVAIDEDDSKATLKLTSLSGIMETMLQRPQLSKPSHQSATFDLSRTKIDSELTEPTLVFHATQRKVVNCN